MRRTPSIQSQAGYSLVEISVAIVIAVFLLAGLFNILQDTKDTSTNQTALTQLQDNQRISMTLLTDVVEEAGYYPNPVNTAMQNVFTATAPYTQVGQLLYGATNTAYGASYGDTISVRYQPDGTTVIGCAGNVDTSVLHTYQFFVGPYPLATPTSTTSALYCQEDGGTPIVLVIGVTKMSVLYGTYSAGATAGASGTVDCYLTAAQLGTTVMWSNIYSVKITLQFPNPLYGQPGNTSAARQFITFERVIGLMSKTGVNTSTFT